jgi:malonate-semialdehyde dehydrogenase (acetylating)/methylmalonate-semialdehyde dehydrogenase
LILNSVVVTSDRSLVSFFLVLTLSLSLSLSLIIMPVKVLENYVDGQYVAPLSAQSTQYLDVTSPHSEAVIAKVPLCGSQDVDIAVQAAAKAFPAWSSKTVKTRVQLLIKFHALVEKYADELADLIVLEHGKTKPEALAEVAKGNETVEYAMCMPQISQGKCLEVSRGVWCRDERRPIGVIATVVPL